MASPQVLVCSASACWAGLPAAADLGDETGLSMPNGNAAAEPLAKAAQVKAAPRVAKRWHETKAYGRIVI